MAKISEHEAITRLKKLTRVCKTSEPAQRIVSFTAEIMGGFCVISHALFLALQAWHLAHDQGRQ